MRTLLLLVLAVLGIPKVVSAPIVEGPRPGGPSPVPPSRPGVPCGRPMCDFQPPFVVRQSSDVRVELVDRVLRYEVTETFINRGNRVGEADFMFPLPKGAAFQDLKLSINGEMASGWTK